MTSTDYLHGYHAGNVGDVWKHCALVSLIAALRRAEGPRCYLETHAGVGRYLLGSTGEWTEGIGKLARLEDPSLPAAVVGYREQVRRLGFGAGGQGAIYPGSPELALGLLGAEDRAIFHELAEPARLALSENLAGEARATVYGEDGLGALPARLAEAATAPIRVVLIDPPYTDRGEWTLVPDALREAYRVDPAAHLCLWYPVKSLTRPEAMLRRIRAAGVPATALELITTPLELKRNRLNGSGVLLVNPPPGVLAEVAAAAPVLGAICATHEGRWFTRGISWA
jgi:23S rRNA (adenine2030-N6)-methyltransferase